MRTIFFPHHSTPIEQCLSIDNIKCSRCKDAYIHTYTMYEKRNANYMSNPINLLKIMVILLNVKHTNCKGITKTTSLQYLNQSTLLLYRQSMCKVSPLKKDGLMTVLVEVFKFEELVILTWKFTKLCLYHKSRDMHIQGVFLSSI